MVFDIFQGDPRLILTNDGATLKFVGGQPVMDQGIENQILISLFTRKGWCGNVLARSDDEVIGSNFEEEVNQPITRTSLNRIRQAALAALNSPLFGEVDVEVTNPNANRLHVLIKISAPNPTTLLLTSNGINWEMQTKNPAYRRI